ncbi:MAG: sigma-70 family RNA polymerase sigma factor [Bryobacterales bacterium]|nr:sigma-70 family RNA polymerase sigma factor [Bryobacterales bacterium]
MTGDITAILDQWGRGDRTALERLAPLVYPQLRTIAASCLNRESPGHTLQATGLVNELFLKFLARREARFESRAHFYALSAKLMRMALIDHARNGSAQKRGGGEAVFVPLHDEIPWINAADPEVVDLDRAIEELEQLDAEQARMVELRFILGCSVEETAGLLGVSKSSVDRKVRLARAWLFARLRGTDAPAPDLAP